MPVPSPVIERALLRHTDYSFTVFRIDNMCGEFNVDSKAEYSA